MPNFNSLSKELFAKKHYNSKTGDKTPEDVFRRVSKAIASQEKTKELKTKYEQEFFHLLSTMEFIPGGRIYNGAGTDFNYLLNCAVLPIEDDFENIYETLKKSAVLNKTNYGTGINFSKLRPKNSNLSSGGAAGGPIEFMKIFDTSGKIVMTTGHRRAAQIGILNVDHPDIEEFIEAKHQEGVLTQFNISIGITQEFIDAVRNDGPWELKFNGKVYKKMKARDLWKKFLHSGHNFNDPGFLFLDQINKHNNGYYLYSLDSTNPCLHPDQEVLYSETNGTGVVAKTSKVSSIVDKEVFVLDEKNNWVKTKFVVTGYDQEILEITLNTDEVIKVTPYHTMILDNGNKLDARRLAVGDKLKNTCLNDIIITGVKNIGKVDKVYCCNVETTHSFSLANGVIVGNCGELALCSDLGKGSSVCCLGNVNITKFVRDAFADGVSFDFEKYEKAIRTGVRFLDNVLDESDYPYAFLREGVEADRRIGLNGISAIGSALAMMKIPYDSIEAIDFTKKICEIWRNTAYDESCELAKEKGSFKNFDVELHLKGEFIKLLPQEIKDKIAVTGIRNVALMTIPPVGTGSLLANNISNGIEPIFSLEYNRHIRQGSGDDVKTELVEDYAWNMYKSLGKPDGDKPEYFKTSMEISPKSHINLQAAAQYFIDGQISKTVNLPESCSIHEYEELVWAAIDAGNKGFTSFRAGTRQGVLEEKKEDKKHKEHENIGQEEPNELYDEEAWPSKIKSAEPKKKRPKVLHGSTYRCQDDKGKLLVTINNIEAKTGKHKPFEIILTANSQNSGNQAWYSAIGKVLSALFRRVDNPMFIAKELQSIYSDAGWFADGRYNKSQPQLVGTILEEHILALLPEEAEKKKKENKAEMCPECGENTLIRTGGCNQCQCGYSTCG